ncbi:sugar transferase [Solirhodobacter olei]|uniref:sugar transferase n=1 Tax=Solirhodobacter olei TaxID=2493082 RepID=UPI000FDB8824|nr:sugar transferase [Solirhodobacter olei]
MTRSFASDSFDTTRPARAVARQARAGGLYDHGIKRALDILLVLASAPFSLPLILLVAALAALDGHNPFFLQIRLGRGGTRFRMIKIRTMVPDAEARLQALLAADPGAAREWAAYQKLRRDPRIAPLGRVLRAASLDELPQLLNVLAGHMSLVGPRPMLPEQRALYPGTAYEGLRPGLTGLWQTEARNHATFAERALFDSCYAASLSLATDMRILARTVRAVVQLPGE